MKKFLKIVPPLVFFMCTLFCVPAQAYAPSDFEVASEAALLISLDTKDILYSKNPNKKMYPASLTKIMTAVLVIEAVPDLDKEIVTVTADQLAQMAGVDSTSMGLKNGEQLTARQLLYMLMLGSGNDISIILSEHIAGTGTQFVARMNQKAGELQMTGTHFANPHGLHDDNHYTTANDMYKLCRYALDRPVFNEVVNATRFHMPATNKNAARIISTGNLFIDPSAGAYYKDARGIKVGFTNQAGRCFATTANRGGFNYVCILMGAPEKGKTRPEFADAKNLFNWAFKDFSYKRLILETEPLDTVKVSLCWDRDTLNVVAAKPYASLFPSKGDASTIIKQIKLDAGEIKAPVKKGDKLGTATLLYAGEEIGTIDLVAAETANRNEFLALISTTKMVALSPIFLAVAGAVAVVVIGLMISVAVWSRKRRRLKRVKTRFKG